MLSRSIWLTALSFLFAHAASAGGHLYWSMGSLATGQIQRCDVDACVPETIVSGIGAIGIDVDPVKRRIYWADVFVGQIRKATETGASNQLVHQAAAGLNTDLAVDPPSVVRSTGIRTAGYGSRVSIWMDRTSRRF